MGRTLHQTIIGQDAIKKTALGRYLHYQPCPEITLNPALAERCRQQHAIAIAGPATTLTLVDLANQLPIDITDQNELYLHPFARCEHLVCGDWTVITVPAAPEKQTLLEQVRGSRRGALALPTAISLIWVLILWQARNGQRLFGSNRLRTSSKTADGRRIVVQQPDSNAFCLSLADDELRAPGLVAVRKLLC